MMTISMNKGTGVVTCVPSDSPDDWMAISDLRGKKALCQKYKVTQEMASIPLIPIMNIPSIKTEEKEEENLSAVIICK